MNDYKARELEEWEKDYVKKQEDRNLNNIPMDDYGRTFHEQDEDGAIYMIVIIMAIILLVVLKLFKQWLMKGLL